MPSCRRAGCARPSAFRRFACTLLAELPRFTAAYNGALADYRRAHHVRNHAHPVPNLHADGPWLEAPFWLWTADDPERRPVFARPTSSGLLVSDLRGLERLLPLTGPGDAVSAIAALADWEAEGVKLRSRALITTMFIRLMVADLFLHGIGGAKYDEVTDAICERFFGTPPPAFATLSGTLRLPIAEGGSAAPQLPTDAGRLRFELRELRFHPERKVEFRAASNGNRAHLEALVAEKSRWVGAPKNPANAAARHQGIVAANAGLQAFVASDRARLEEQLAAATEGTRARGVLQSREYPACLFPRKMLEHFLLDFSPQAL